MDDVFRQIMDDLVLTFAPVDSELREGLRWIDEQAAKNKVDFYEMALQVLRKHIAEKRAKEWLRQKRY